jgi:hypothetical protein
MYSASSGFFEVAKCGPGGQMDYLVSMKGQSLIS